VLLHIVARGRIGRGPEADLVERYLSRVAWPTKITELPTKTIILDEKGKSLGSVAFAEQLGRWRDEGVRETRFLIGAADGFDDTARAQADLLINFGTLTWPHMLARAMLAEQLWRAASILAGHPYHREG
jgi:23S rRNA (pseudouridine1915-N3)-methyltransferase